jgi:CheY-like chemotaxis protein/two-component sensor histidine kinase
MALLLDDLLDVSRITRGKLELRRQRASLRQIVDVALETARPLVEAKRHRLEVSLPPDDGQVDVDPLRISQVIGNLLTNAAKYTEPGGHVWLTATLDAQTIAVSVRDTGIGLTPEQCRSVFEMFAQTATGRARAQGGLGIGLALVQEIVTRHGGRVAAHSDGPGRGSTFTVHLPVSSFALPVPAAAPAATAAPCARRWRVLLVDDLHDAADSLAAMLTLMGHETRTAYDGRAAVAAAEDFRPDLILLDIGLPILDGHEVARRIRCEPWGRATVLVALTGWAQEDDRRCGIDAVFDHYWTKPVEPQVIEALLSTAPPM